MTIDETNANGPFSGQAAEYRCVVSERIAVGRRAYRSVGVLRDLLIGADLARCWSSSTKVLSNARL